MDKRILVVDDDPDISKILKTAIECLGYEVILAKNGMEGTTFAIQYKPDLIILDVMMPKMSGFQTCKAIRSRPDLQNTPVIFLTAKSAPKDKEWGEKMGGDDYITKPFEINILTEKIRKMLKKKTPKENPEDRLEYIPNKKKNWEG